MAKIIVKKSNPLKGNVRIDGAKNAVLPIICLLYTSPSPRD